MKGRKCVGRKSWQEEITTVQPKMKTAKKKRMMNKTMEIISKQVLGSKRCETHTQKEDAKTDKN